MIKGFNQSINMPYKHEHVIDTQKTLQNACVILTPIEYAKLTYLLFNKAKCHSLYHKYLKL